MIIFLYGEDAYRSKKKLYEIIEQYRAKHQSGLNFSRLQENFDWSEVKARLSSVSMFAEKKLVVFENALAHKEFSSDFIKYARENKIKEDQDLIIVFWEGGRAAGKASVAKIASMAEEFKPFSSSELARWVGTEAKRQGSDIEPAAVNLLCAGVGNDLWQMSREIGKLAVFRPGETIRAADVECLVKPKVALNIFETIDALARADKRSAFRLLHRHLNEGENAIYLLSMFAYQIRTLLKLKALAEQGVAFGLLAKKTSLHPFVVKKSIQQLRNFTLARLKDIFGQLLEADVQIKSGRLDGTAALDMLVNNL